ncbi:MAG: small multi-drug export protein [Clostridia bacterium]|nr:small multi-drug export protein [Clostridia bacterium]
MTDAIERFFLETVGKELCVFFCSMLPIIECRGAVPLGWGLGLPWWQTLLFSVAGNLLPVPFILLFMRGFLKWMRGCKVKFFNKIAAWLDRKIEKHKGTIEKYSYWGVMIFVGVPLPGTGAWTGTLIASVLGLEPKKTFLAAVGGVLMASAIMMIAAYGGLGLIFG